MTVIDLRLEYLKDTGKYAPMIIDEKIFNTASNEDYIEWLENKIIELSKPVIIHGEAFRTTINKNKT